MREVSILSFASEVLRLEVSKPEVCLVLWTPLFKLIVVGPGFEKSFGDRKRVYSN